MAGEGQLTTAGALAVTTGAYTGRSPKDKFIVRDALTEDQCLVGQCRRDDARRAFDLLLADMLAYAAGREL